jgi:dienelactone hydrolase/predicted RNase H-like HicB family nuclease
MSYKSTGVRIVGAILFAWMLMGMNADAAETRAPRVVELKAPDGIVLKATYFAAGKPGPGVLLLHQCNRQRKVWDDLAGRLAASGVNVLTMDFRGFGESGGTPFDKMPPEEINKSVEEKWPGDVDTAFRYLIAQPGVSRRIVGGGGASCGVNQAVQLARRHAEVKSLVLLSEGTDAAGRKYLRESPKVQLFMAVADDDDDRGVVEIMEWLYALSPNPGNKLEHYAVGGHGVEMFKAHGDLEGMIVEWFGKTLKANATVSAKSGAAKPASREMQFLEMIDQPGGVAKATKTYEEARQKDPKVALFSEVVMNRVGYEHLQAGDVKGAIELLQLNVAAYPDSPNVYDSVSDAYLAAGQNEQALENAKKALELLAKDTTDSQAVRDGIKTNAEEKLKKLAEGPK